MNTNVIWQKKINSSTRKLQACIDIRFFCIALYQQIKNLLILDKKRQKKHFGTHNQVSASKCKNKQINCSNKFRSKIHIKNKFDRRLTNSQKTHHLKGYRIATYPRLCRRWETNKHKTKNFYRIIKFKRLIRN